MLKINKKIFSLTQNKEFFDLCTDTQKYGTYKYWNVYLINHKKNICIGTHNKEFLDIYPVVWVT